MNKTKSWIVAVVVTILGSSFLYFYSGNLAFKSDEKEAEIEIDPTEFSLPTLYYGIAIDSLEVTKGRVRWNQNLSEILSQYNISYEDLHVLSKKSKSVYDVRKLKAGATYSILHTGDSLKTAQHFIFEPSLTEYVIYSFVDSVNAVLKNKPVEVRERILAAEITSSVYESIIDNGSSPVLANQLVDVFAWQVDFDRIAKGDKFKVIFEEEIVDGKVVDIREIKGAYFEHWNKTHYAIPYDLGDKIEYFDQTGKSLRKTFLKYPLKYFDRISSRYSLRRFHPVQKRYKAHLGTDYAARPGTPIRTVGDGVVLEARYHGGNGNYVKIKHNSNYTTQYLHMKSIKKGIRPGTKVKQGQTIGYVGSTGLATGPHLCFRFWKNGRQVDALKVNLPSSKGIDSMQIADFRMVSESIVAQLKSIEFASDKKLLAEIHENASVSGNRDSEEE
ncbi:MAG: peptidoglycan DD-metalloendopeptidase family protein [Bacteroidota bacterium]